MYFKLLKYTCFQIQDVLNILQFKAQNETSFETRKQTCFANCVRLASDSNITDQLKQT